MVKLQGTRVFGGYAIGTVSFFDNKKEAVERRHAADPSAEEARFNEAREKAKAELQALCDKTMNAADDESAKIFEVHQMMLDDLDFEDAVMEGIRTEGVNAEYAVQQAGQNLSEVFAQMDDEYMRARAADLLDISDRVIAILSGKKKKTLSPTDEPVILLAEDLSPSETVQLDRSKILAFVTRFGSVNSHTAILARSMGIPAIIGLDFDAAMDGHQAIVDGYGGLLLTDPDEETLKHYEERKQQDDEARALLGELKGKENITLDGRTIEIFANIGGVDDVEDALRNDAGGVGLFRSEFLYLGREDYPDEETQFQAYKTVAEKMNGKKVIIRTLDIGADKRVSYFDLPPEENPALGYRAIRICLDRPDVLRTQLRAILRASAFGNIAVMYPMIASVWEIQRLKELFAEVQGDLSDEHIAFSDEVEQGVMIETPAAVLISEELAQEVDFFSIGTNDLTQYVLAADRQNPRLAPYSDAHHPALLRAIRMTVESAHRYGKAVGICGELAADTLMTEFFLQLGVDELSVTPSMVLAVRDAVRKTDLRG
ncbi:MAG: phosphoenolpyruvate--protein phosphotransferase [Lachnospiraceae bacterium]|nr:phosphoenolpyruvate--protein phosphotransferase [Lachnospiraceae bacterium]